MGPEVLTPYPRPVRSVMWWVQVEVNLDTAELTGSGQVRFSPQRLSHHYRPTLSPVALLPSDSQLVSTVLLPPLPSLRTVFCTRITMFFEQTPRSRRFLLILLFQRFAWCQTMPVYNPTPMHSLRSTVQSLKGRSIQCLFCLIVSPLPHTG